MATTRGSALIGVAADRGMARGGTITDRKQIGDAPGLTAQGRGEWTRSAPATRELLPQDRLERYTVLDRLGAGGMGVVYAAFDPWLNRKVALKLLTPETTHSEARRRRLLCEGQALARLSHTNVVTVFEAGSVGRHIYLAMEHVDGTTLARWLRAATRSQRQILQSFVKAGAGLAAAHDAGIVHRDFKPENVLVGRDGRVRVSDFGLARFETADALDPVSPPAHRPIETGGGTVSGVLLGTPAYMAPEQWDGRHADARSDQFSFCVALWEALAGVRPFEVRGGQRWADQSCMRRRISRLLLLPEGTGVARGATCMCARFGLERGRMRSLTCNKRRKAESRRI